MSDRRPQDQRLCNKIHLSLAMINLAYFLRYLRIGVNDGGNHTARVVYYLMSLGMAAKGGNYKRISRLAGIGSPTENRTQDL